MAVKGYILLLILLATTSVQAQKQADWWYFGDQAGIHFVNNVPVGVTDGAMTTNEGSAVISDANGKLLFYTSGTDAWDRSHSYVPNGQNLKGSFSSTQSAVCVPWPGDKFRYFLFTVDKEGGPNGMQYCVIDMTLNGGLGGLTLKDSVLFTPSTEKITAVKHANGTDYWVIGHKAKSKDFVAYLVTSAGIQKKTPVISSVGTVHSPSDKYDNIGYMKSSPDGSHIAVAIHTQRIVELLDFDPSSGTVSNPASFQMAADYFPYGIEFSPDGKKLYVANISSANSVFYILQYDLSSGGYPSTNIIQTSTSLGALQLGPNGYIYAARPGTSTLSEISNPNMAGTACNYTEGSVDLQGKICRLGLPTFIQSFFVNNNFTFKYNCFGSSTRFQVTDSVKVDSVKWDFDDPTSASNTDTSNTTDHVFSDTGTYYVKLYFYSGGFEDSVIKRIYIYPQPNVQLGNDTNICGQVNITLSAPQGFDLYLWSTGDSLSSVTVTQTGKYWVSVSNICGLASDTITINAVDLANLGPDSTFCDSINMILDAGGGALSYAWSTGDTTQKISILSPGTYWVDVTSLCGTQRDSVEYTLLQTPVFSLAKEIYKCVDEPVVLQSGVDNAMILWSTGDTTAGVEVNQPGIYTVSATRGICKDSARTLVKDFTYKKLQLGGPYAWCGDTAQGIWLHSSGYISYLWQSGQVDSNLYVSVPGFYSLTVTDTNNCRQTDSVQVFTKCPPLLWMPTAFTPGNDQMNELFKPVATYVHTYIFYIYNRWGELVYTGTQDSTGWDGTFKGKPCQQDLYRWWLYYEGERSSTYHDGEVLSGSVVLLRSTR